MRFSSRSLSLFILGFSLVGSLFLFVQNRENFFVFEAPRVELAEKSEPLQISKNIQNSQNSKLLAKALAASFFENNPEGPDPATLSAVVENPDTFVNEFLDKNLEKMKAEFLSVSVETEKIVLEKIDTQEIKEKYIQARAQLISQSAAAMAQDNLVGNPSASNFALLSNILTDLLVDLYNLPVPASALSIHSEQIRLITIQRDIFASLASYKDDALRAWVSVSIFAEVNQNFADLKLVLSEFILEHNLTTT